MYSAIHLSSVAAVDEKHHGPGLSLCSPLHVPPHPPLLGLFQLASEKKNQIVEEEFFMSGTAVASTHGTASGSPQVRFFCFFSSELILGWNLQRSLWIEPPQLPSMCCR